MKTKRTILVLAMMLAAVSVAGNSGRFQRYDFEVKGNVTDLITEDLDGDSLVDIIAIHTDSSTDPPTRYLSVYYQKRAGKFNSSRDVLWEFPPAVAAVDVGDVSSDPGKELVFITEEGIFYAPLRSDGIGSMQKMFDIQSVVAIAYHQEVPYYNFVRDYTGNGRDDMVACGFYDATVFRQKEGYEWSSQKINLRPDMRINSFDMNEIMDKKKDPFLRVSYRVPQLVARDYNGDGLVDLIASFEDGFQIYGNKGETYTRDPVKKYSMELIPYEKGSRDRRRDNVNINYTDLDGDGRMDVLANHINGQVTNLKSKTALFWGKSDNIEKGKPDIEFETEHPVMGSPLPMDVNKDGRKDLLLPTFNMSAWSVGKAIFTGDVHLQWAYFLQTPERSFNTKPDYVRTTGLKLSVTKFRMTSGLPNIIGDFNGDGYPDLALGEKENLFKVTILDKQGHPTELVEEIQMPVSMINRVEDFDSNGRSDLLIYYPQKPEYASEFRVLINKGPWKMPE
ncbi:MAG: FG-GAP and VCBS repeat-containing protein [bacterium]